MAITITPCTASGDPIFPPGSLTYAVYPGGLDVNAESTPHIKIVNDGDSAVTLVASGQVMDSFNSNYNSGNPIQKSYSVPANTTKVFAYLLTFENLSTFQGYMRSVHTISADIAVKVRYTWTQSGSSTEIAYRDVTYHITGPEFKRWYEQRGFPRFDMDYTRLQRTAYNSQSSTWVDSDTGTGCTVYGKIIIPAHFPFPTQIRMSAWERIGAATPTSKASDLQVDYFSNATDVNAEQSSNGGSSGVYGMTGMLKVTYTLSWRSQGNSFETIDTLTLYMSYIKPAIELDLNGTGVAFGKYASGLGHLFEVAQDWDVEMPGNVSVGTLDANALSNDLKTIILNAVYPLGSYVFAESSQALALLLNNFPGTWTIGSYYYVMQRSDGYTGSLHFAQRTG